jgi:hypothetical protein
MLGTNGKMKNNLSLLGTKFDTILEHIFLVGAKRKECLFTIIVVKIKITNYKKNCKQIYSNSIGCNIYKKMKP